jgi:hypothetical protein
LLIATAIPARAGATAATTTTVVVGSASPAPRPASSSAGQISSAGVPAPTRSSTSRAPVARPRPVMSGARGPMRPARPPGRRSGDHHAEAERQHAQPDSNAERSWTSWKNVAK